MAPTEKRRRRKVRVVDQDSSDSSSDSEQENLSKISDDEPSELSDAHMSSDEEEPSNTKIEPEFDNEEPRELLHKAPKNQTPAEFNQKFLELVTQQFGEELAALRETNDFGPASLNQLVAGLKQGVDIFDDEQKRLL
ncbi:hypothetical protein DASB73_012250 [Starmerella bacillaris]|uniref:Ribosome assembly protein 3 n=1 Tax=Starmerella bacillaris TaxID=1247836 RepID=A0AAV5RGC9_STABA|nr:hypothetical protein DASB73_012250 [Starmerella bacillaris]